MADDMSRAETAAPEIASSAAVTPESTAPEAADALGAAPGKVLSPAAKRALEEAAARRAEIDAAGEVPKEYNGRGGKEPVRYGDWEVGGIASDF